MSLTQDLIGLIRNKPTASSDLEQAALFTLDAIACAYAGSATPVGEVLRAWAADDSVDGKPHALLMAALTHITETDDLHRASVTHPGCVVIPAVLSLGAAQQADGRRILHSILHGYEAMCRIGAAVGPAHYRVWHNTATCGPFGAAMAAAQLFDLDDAQAMNALGNAGTQASGFWQFMQTGAMSKHLHAGRACDAGLLAAGLARHGFSGPPEILEGGKGFFVAMCGDPEPDKILECPDAPWQLRQTSIKPWPSCRHTHPIIDCALELHAQLEGDVVEQIEIETYQAALDVCDCRDPDSEYQAKFSLYHCAAIALLDGAVGLESFDPEARERSAALRQAISIRVLDPYKSNYPKSWGAQVGVTTRSGQAIRASRKDCKGDPELALDAAEMRAKAIGLLTYGGLDIDHANELCDTVLALPDTTTTPELFREFMRYLGLD